MPRKREPEQTHWYNVLVFSYVDEASMKEQVVTFERITAVSFYSGFSWPKARVALGHAVIAASRKPLAYSVQVRQDEQVIIKVKIEHD
jgi:hypothetical protein